MCNIATDRCSDVTRVLLINNFAPLSRQKSILNFTDFSLSGPLALLISLKAFSACLVSPGGKRIIRKIIN